MRKQKQVSSKIKSLRVSALTLIHTMHHEDKYLVVTNDGSLWELQVNNKKECTWTKLQTTMPFINQEKKDGLEAESTDNK